MSKSVKNFIAAIIVACAFQNYASAAGSAPPALRPPIKQVQKVSAPVQKVETPSRVNSVKQEPQNVEKVDFVKNLKTNSSKTKKKIEVYTDEHGNQISKEQKERSEMLKKTYKGVTKEEKIMEALELLKGGLGDFSRKAILGNNLSEKPMQVSFANLANFGQAYANFDALGWKKKNRLYVYINEKHEDAPAAALAAVLAHEALHQDDFNSLNEETYAWTLEAAVWTKLSEKYPEYKDSMHPLVVRENTLKKLFIKGNYTGKYIKKTVWANPGYSNLPSRSPGFEDDSL